MLGASGCIADEDACGAHQVIARNTVLMQSTTVCVCDEAAGYVLDSARGHGCVRCQGDEIVKGGRCVAPPSDDPDAGMAPSEPTGVGVPCSNNADCAPYDAQLCDVIMTKACVLDRCATGENTCPATQACCDLSHLAAGVSVCIDSAIVDADGCPMGGMRVDP